MAVPQFGAWDHKSFGSTDYSVVFSKARANKKHHKNNFNHAGLRDQGEILNAAAHHYRKEEPPVMRGQKAASTTKNKHAYVGGYKKAQKTPDLALPVKKAEKTPNLALPVKKAEKTPDLALPVKKVRAHENHHWRSVPQFGGWDQEAPGSTDYSVLFAQARANRKQHKRNFNRASLGCEKELMATSAYRHQKEEPIVGKNKVLSYFNCCMWI
ncbi:hypothetical protein SAY87_028582 [Trapa incisa]|uniref:RIN4 pathogenic type III effector avirulence factor Avr cleavage site domain-containing protein n=1 Tax=Trapa incisa TaxID=236973 RepID=A0AAN7KPG8_9MYRT|nr:hypothetical protein SAY87_028582 [Trapa incisa]